MGTPANRISRSLLFVPGQRPERFEKAAASGTHDIVLDLEDAVAPGAKDAARDAVAGWLKSFTGFGRSAYVRINDAQTPWFEADLRMLDALPGVGVMLPKADLASLARTLTALPGRRVIALVETVAGYMESAQIAKTPGLERIAFGSVDFASDSGIADEGEALTSVRVQIVLHSCLAGLAAPVDGVSINFSDPDLMRADALRSRQLGFGGKLCIHPSQVSVVNDAFSPTPQELDWARRVIAAFEASQGAATAVDGKMIDKPVVDRARRIASEAPEGLTA